MLLSAEQLLGAIPATILNEGVEQYAIQHLRKNIVRKFISGRTQAQELDARALQSFLARNTGDVTISRHAEATTPEQRVLREVEYQLRRFFEPYVGDRHMDHVIPSWNHVVQCARMGPKASSGVRSNSLYAKLFNSSLGTSDPDLRWIYNRIVGVDPRWRAAESQRHLIRGSDDTCGSTVSFVPKNATTSRTIGTEPPLNMFFQLGIGRLIENRLKDYGIAISNDYGLSNQQIVNRALAKRGSTTGLLATLDLSHASDSLTNVLIRSYLPSSALHYLEKARTPKARLPGGQVIDLEIFSTMGNGFNFPLQTAFYLCVVLACYKTLGIHASLHGRSETRNVGVYGDDIIVATRAVPLVSRVLYLLGFDLNTDKSFSDGEFRESCGGDYYRGHDVTPFYIKRCDTEADLYVHANAILRWTQVTGVYLHDLFFLILDRLSSLRKRIFVVPQYLGDDAGLKLPWLWASYVGSFRRDNNGSVRCQHLQVKNILQNLYRNRKPFQERRRLDDKRRLWVNPIGLALVHLHGDIRNGKLQWDKPSAVPDYTVVTRTVPSWDVGPDGTYSPHELTDRVSVARSYIDSRVTGLFSPLAPS